MIVVDHVLAHSMLGESDDVKLTLKNFAGGDLALELFVTETITFSSGSFDFRQ
jgi:hypothetical protein